MSAAARLGPRHAPLTAALLAVLVLAANGCGAGSSNTHEAAARLQREDLISVAHALAGVQRRVGDEVSATKAAWPAVANGLPTRPSTSDVALVRTAARSSGSLEPPTLLKAGQTNTLTGPASGVAGLFRGYAALSGRGWAMIAGALDEIERGAPTAASFARANVALYIESVYDAHFGLAQIGRRLKDAYDELGGADAFGSALTEREVSKLVADYSEAQDRLHPHTGVKLGS
ncbi:MAG TPA: hypothetical protein VGG08_03055 [Solirubrobacteraceae bacterium]